MISEDINNLIDELLQEIASRGSGEYQLTEKSFNLLRQIVFRDARDIVYIKENADRAIKSTFYGVDVTVKRSNINTFCENKDSKYTMNYWDENGCLDRKRILVEPSEIYIMPEKSIHWDDIEKK